MSVIAKELDYQKYAISHGSYQLTQLTQQTGGQTVTIANGGEESIFELSPKVFNYAHSILQWASTPTKGTHYNWMYADGISHIRQLQLYTRSGLFLVDLNDVGNYTNMTLRRETKAEEMLTYDKVAGGSGYFEGLAPCDSLDTANLRPGYAVATGSTTSYLEPLYMVVGGDNTDTPVMNYQIPLSRFKNTLLAIDKNMYFGGEMLYLRIVWNNPSKIYFNTTANDGTRAGSAVGTGVAISNLMLYMAVEQNPVIEQELKAKVNSGEGFNLLVPYVYQNKQTIQGSTQTITVKYNRAHGSKLLKIYWAPFNPAETNFSAYDHSNLTNANPPAQQGKITNFYTLINNIRTSQFNYNCTGDDWMAQKLKLKGSCIFSSNEYYFNYVWVEDFTNNYSLVDKPLTPPEVNYIDGLDLNTEIKYDIYANINSSVALPPSGSTPAVVGLAHYVYAVCQKTLVVNSSGISLL